MFKYQNKIISTSLLVLSLSSSNVFAEKRMQTTFDWDLRHLSPGKTLDLNYNNVPFAGHDYLADHPYNVNTYTSLFNAGNIMALTLAIDTAPVYGQKDKDALKTVKSYIQRLDYVFADFEEKWVKGVLVYDYSQIIEDTNEMVRQVRTDPNSNINQAYIGQYGWHAGKTAYYDLPGLFSRTDPANNRARSNMVQDYLDSGVNISMPICYFYRTNWVHTLADGNTGWALQFGPDNISPTIPAALFWVSLERYSSAKRDLPEGHKIIPWVGPWVDRPGIFPNDSVREPNRLDNQALLEHLRLRGADGYYSLLEPDSTPSYYLNSTEFREDMNATWRLLDDFMFPSAVTTVLNTDTNKTGGIEWSGLRHVNDIKILVSNFNELEKDVDYPDIYGLPDRSPLVAPFSTHSFYEYTITNLLKNGDFNAGVANWNLVAATWTATEGVDGTGGIKLQNGQYSALETYGADVEPGAHMVLEVQAKGENNAQLRSNYYFYDAAGNVIYYLSGTGLNYANTGLNIVPGSDYKTYRQTFTVPNVKGIKSIRPVFYNSFGATDPNDVLWLDNIVIKFADLNLIANGDFNTGADGWYFSSGNWEANSGVSNTGNIKLQGGVYSVHAAGLKVKAISGQELSLDLDARGVGNAGIKVSYYYYDSAGNNLGFATTGLDESLDSTFQTYHQNFIVGTPSAGVVDYIVPIIYNTFADDDPVNNVIWVDNIAITSAVTGNDIDRDGFADNADNCSALSNDQSDIDNDGLGDLCDNDVDGDGITNVADNCPDLANTDQVDIDGDRMGDVCDF